MNKTTTTNLLKVPIDKKKNQRYNKDTKSNREETKMFNMFMSKKEKLAKREALSKEYAETVKKAMEIEATKGEKFSWSYKMKAEQLLNEMSKIKF